MKTRVPSHNRRALNPPSEQYRAACQRPSTVTQSSLDRIQKLSEDRCFTLVLGGGVRDEVQHLNSIANEKPGTLSQIFNFRSQLISGHRAEHQPVTGSSRGNAQPVRMPISSRPYFIRG